MPKSFFTATRALGKTVPDSMNSLRPYQDCSASKERPRIPNRRRSFPICDNVVGWLGTVGIVAALHRRALEGGSYRVTVSLTRTVLWLLSLGIFDKAYAQATGGFGSSDEHADVAPDLFTAETPLDTYQGLTDQVVTSRAPGSFRTVLVLRGSSKPRMASALRAPVTERQLLKP
jgi:hypothetical protein